MKPFSTCALLKTHQGNVPLPDCSSTLGLLGAVGSGLTAQRGVPFPVTPCCQAEGNAPLASPSKLIVSAKAAPVAKMVAAAMQASFMVAPSGARAGSEQSSDACASVRRGVCCRPRVLL